MNRRQVYALRYCHALFRLHVIQRCQRCCRRTKQSRLVTPASFVSEWLCRNTSDKESRVSVVSLPLIQSHYSNADMLFSYIFPLPILYKLTNVPILNNCNQIQISPSYCVFIFIHFAGSLLYFNCFSLFISLCIFLYYPVVHIYCFSTIHYLCYLCAMLPTSLIHPPPVSIQK